MGNVLSPTSWAAVLNFGPATKTSGDLSAGSLDKKLNAIGAHLIGLR